MFIIKMKPLRLHIFKTHCRYSNDWHINTLFTMKNRFLIFAFAALTTLYACDKIVEEDGISRIYLTNINEGVTSITTENVSIDKENKIIKYAFGINVSGFSQKGTCSVDFHIDNSILPEGTIALEPAEYTLTTKNGETVPETFVLSKGEALYLEISEEVLKQHATDKLGLGLKLANATKYELSENLSSTSLVVDASEFMGSYLDVTDLYLKNTKSPYNKTPDSPPDNGYDGYHQTPTDWVVNEAVKIHQYTNGKYYGGLDGRGWGGFRSWLSISNYDYPHIPILNGKIYQTTQLPAGQYSIEYEIKESWGGEGKVAWVVNESNELVDFNLLNSSIAWKEFVNTVPLYFNLDTETTVSTGLVCDIPSGFGSHAYALVDVKLSRLMTAFD